MGGTDRLCPPTQGLTLHPDYGIIELTKGNKMNATHTGDLLVSFGLNQKGYSIFRVEDCFNFNSAITSGVTIKMKSDLANRELDLESIIQIEPRVRVSYEWSYSKYIVGKGTEEEQDKNLPEEWYPEIDQNDEFTWPSVDRYEWYEDGKLVKVRYWEFGNEDWAK